MPCYIESIGGHLVSHIYWTIITGESRISRILKLD